jgi:hypothetical protein
VKVSCRECGKLFDAQTRARVFCGTACRKRSSDRDIAARKEAELASISPISTPETAVDPAETPLIATTRRELEEAGVADTVNGQIALRLAEKLSQPGDTGSAMASLARQLATAMSDALASGTKKADALDELAAWRDRKASGA